MTGDGGPADRRADGRPHITVFRSRRRAGGDDSYDAWAEATESAARTVPGFVELKTFTADDGERVTISVFDSPQAQESWRTHPIHLEAQSLGRTTFYDSYDLTVAAVLRRHRWAREPQEPEDRPI
jgi:heme-degrading monooxygenase HmoA